MYLKIVFYSILKLCAYGYISIFERYPCLCFCYNARILVYKFLHRELEQPSIGLQKLKEWNSEMTKINRTKCYLLEILKERNSTDEDNTLNLFNFAALYLANSTCQDNISLKLNTWNGNIKWRIADP